MTQEEKSLLLKDLGARLPYGIKVHAENIDVDASMGGIGKYSVYLTEYIDWFNIEFIKPYLRPMSSMTEEEIAELKWLNEKCDAMPTFEYMPVENYRIYDWMNRHHFDFRGLIEKGLALEAPEGMYKTKEN